MISRLAAVIGVVFLMCAWGVPAQAQDPSEFAGEWAINRQLSQFPQEIGFSASFMPPPENRDSPGGGRGGREFGGRQLPPRILTTTAEDAARVRFLTDEVRLAPERLTIVVTPAMVVITPDRGAARTLQPGRRDQEVTLGPVMSVTNTAWDTGHLIVVYRADTNRLLRYIFSIAETPRQLTVDIEFIERGAIGDKVRRVYEPAPPAPPASSTGGASQTSSTATAPLPEPLGSKPAGAPPTRSLRELASGAFPASPAAAAAGAVDERPDAALKGLTRLGLVVEGLGSQALKCGLKQEALEEAVTKRLTDAGIRVLRESDEDTYLYVNAGTVTTAAALCVTRYDVTLYSHGAARLPHTTSAVPVQAELLHRGGMTGGSAASHADTVLKSLLEDVDTVATRLKTANQP